MTQASHAVAASTHAPHVFVSIVHWNGGAGTLACIESVLADGLGASGGRLSIVVVDNASTDGIADEIARRWPDIAILRHARNLGFTGGQNRGMRHAVDAGADYVLLLNQDAIVLPGCLARMTALAEADATIGLVSPVVRFADEPSRVQFCGSWMTDLRSMEIHYSGDIDVVRSHDGRADEILCLWGTALMLRRAVIEQVGVLDEPLFAYFEDTDYSIRAAQAGWRARMCFDASILHEGHPTRSTRQPNYFYFTCRNEMRFWAAVLPRRDRLRARRKATARAIREAAQLQGEGLAAQVDACVHGLWDGWRGRYGAYDASRRAPRWLRALLLWHPWFLADLLDGRRPAVPGRRRWSAS